MSDEKELVKTIEDAMEQYYNDEYDAQENEFEHPSTEQIVNWMMADKNINEALSKFLARQVEQRREHYDNVLTDTMSDWNEPEATDRALEAHQRKSDVSRLNRR